MSRRQGKKRQWKDKKKPWHSRLRRENARFWGVIRGVNI